MSLDTIPASLFLDFIPFSIIGMVSEDKSKSRAKKKRVVKKISRDEEDEDEMKPLEEKVIHRQKARLSVKDGGEWEERGQGYVKVIKHL